VGPNAVSAPGPDSPGVDLTDVRPAEVGDVESPARGDGVDVSRLGSGTDPATYIVQLEEPAAPAYEGGVTGLAATAAESGEQLDAEAPAVAAYEAHLEDGQAEVRASIARTIGREPEVLATFQLALNGLAVVLTPSEARKVAALPAVTAIEVDAKVETATYGGVETIGADQVWAGTTELGLPIDARGEGVVVGILDTGANPYHPSFADVGEDGYDHTNPRGRFYGACDPGNAEQFDPSVPCNDKLIGAYSFPAGQAIDTVNGHGAAVGSIAAGNVLTDVEIPFVSGAGPPLDMAGVAPHANVISYGAPDPYRTTAWLAIAVEQAIEDGVDVLNVSLTPWLSWTAWQNSWMLAMLNARAAGIFVSGLLGNDGPTPPDPVAAGGPPWVSVAAATSHRLVVTNGLAGITRDDGVGLADIPGVGFGPGLGGSAPVVLGEAVGDPRCLDGSGHEAEYAGSIVVCRAVEDPTLNWVPYQAFQVSVQGAVGVVVLTDPLDDPFAYASFLPVFPGIEVSQSDGLALVDWLSTGSGHVAMIAGAGVTDDPSHEDALASFSSRGPNGEVDVIVPSFSAPGVDMASAYVAAGPNPAESFGVFSGQSEAAPVVAGAAALLTQLHPDWTPGQQQSALMTTATPTVVDFDGTPATPFEQGSGRIDVAAAARAGLLFDESNSAFLAADPASGGDPSTLNLASFADSSCVVRCSFERTATVPAGTPAGVTWSASVAPDAGLEVDVVVDPAPVSPGDTLTIDVAADVRGAPLGEYRFARITLTPDNPAVPVVTMPLAVVPAASVLPDAVDLTVRREAGSDVLDGLQSIGFDELAATVHGLVSPTESTGELVGDPTPDPFDGSAGVATSTLDVAAGTERLVVETLASEAPDLDLYLGTGPTPGPDTIVCTNLTPWAIERCDLDDPEAGTYWVLIQSFRPSAGAPDAYTLGTTIVDGSVGTAGNAGVVGPAGPVADGVPYDLTLHWDLADSELSDVFYGSIQLGTAADGPDALGEVPIRIRRGPDDVAKTASSAAAVPGEKVTYTITVDPGPAPASSYHLVDTVPEGLSIDPASVSGGGVLDGDTITWDVAVPGPPERGRYVLSSSEDDPVCAAQQFLDLSAFGWALVPPLDGDTAYAGVSNGGAGMAILDNPRESHLVASVDGFLVVPNGAAGMPWLPQVIPDPALPNGVIAPFWTDLEADVAAGSAVHASGGHGFIVVQWENLFAYNGPDPAVGPPVGDFEVIFLTEIDESLPEIVFAYRDLDLDAIGGPVTVGIENRAGTEANSVLGAGDPNGVLSGGNLCFDYVPPTADPLVLTYTATVDGRADGVLVNVVTHTTDDPHGRPEQATASVTVPDQPSPPDVVLVGTAGTRHEGSPLTVTGTVADPDADGPLALTIDWGDGTTSEGTAPAGSFERTHTYTDDGAYTITATVDDGTDTDTATLDDIAIANVAPEVALDTSVTDLTLTAAVSAEDPGDDELAGTIDWGDGTIEDLDLVGDQLQKPGVAAGATTAHTFASAGTYTVEACVRDDDGPTCRPSVVTVGENPGPQPVASAPTPPPADLRPASASPPTPGQGGLPRTGSDALRAMAVAAGLIGLGALLLAMTHRARRRRRSTTRMDGL